MGWVKLQEGEWGPGCSHSALGSELLGIFVTWSWELAASGGSLMRGGRPFKSSSIGLQQLQVLGMMTE